MLNFSSNSSEEIEKFRIEFLGKKGHISRYFSEFKNVDNSQKKEYGLAINKLKSSTLEKIELLKQTVSKISGDEEIDNPEIQQGKGE